MFSGMHNVEILSKIQDLINELTITFKDGIPLYKTDLKNLEELMSLILAMTEELKNRLAIHEKSAFASTKEAKALVMERSREETGKKEWALVSTDPDKKTGKRRVLYWFGTKKPTDKQIAEQEKRINFFKHKKA